jgi:hypothetical protein
MQRIYTMAQTRPIWYIRNAPIRYMNNDNRFDAITILLGYCSYPAGSGILKACILEL